MFLEKIIPKDKKLFLDEGLLEPDTFTPEMEVEFYDGDFNIEYFVIYDEDGKVLFKDPNYKYV